MPQVHTCPWWAVVLMSVQVFKVFAILSRSVPRVYPLATGVGLSSGLPCTSALIAFGVLFKVIATHTMQLETKPQIYGSF